ncbi:FkbM family methyltransferase [Caulobacter sp. NIBR2454]|uniref:FkbM family methyltransferase n=1 Tax=Caulobacter sp. NIBR2454 TaxID=3015996 RepID=UPI0022B73DFC|nr:FkbM family methyltransferase [Caulobacter sp. NIBR2454]
MLPNHVPYGMVMPTLYGPVIVSRHDINQTNHLLKTGRAHGHDSIEMIAKLSTLKSPEPFVLDVGANFGLFSLGMARMLDGRGVYHCFEAQRILFNMIAGSVALNGYTNIFCHHTAVGDGEGSIEIPQFDYNQALNFGSVEFGGAQNERLSQERGQDPDKREFVPMRALDSYGFPRVDILKIDVEGMEDRVLAGANQLIDAYRPIMTVEHLKSDSRALADHIQGKDYKLYVLSDDFVCVPNELAHLIPA